MENAESRFDGVFRAISGPHVLARVVRIFTWQGVALQEFHFEAQAGSEMKLRFTVCCDEWRAVRLNVHLRKIHGVLSVEMQNSDSAASPSALALPCPVAR